MHRVYAKFATSLSITLALLALVLPASALGQGFSGYKAEAVDAVDAQGKLVQEIVDSLFSFSELGFQ